MAMYESDHTKFMREWMEKHPEQRDEQKKGRALWWDKPQRVDEQQRVVAEYLRSQLKKVGIAIEVRTSADFPSWAKRIASRDFDMTMDIVYNWGDPVIGVHRTFLSTNIRPIVWTNTQSYRNPQVDELLNTAGGILDPVKRKAYYATFQKIVTDELPIIQFWCHLMERSFIRREMSLIRP